MIEDFNFEYKFNVDENRWEIVLFYMNDGVQRYTAQYFDEHLLKAVGGTELILMGFQNLIKALNKDLKQ